MAEIGLAVAQTLFAALQCSQLKQLCTFWGYESELETLNKTVTTIKNVLLDVESLTLELTNEQRSYVDDLKEAVYEADDLFDEFVTLLELNQLEELQSKGGRFYKKVRHFFASDKNQLSQAYKMHEKVKMIQKNLTAIVNNHHKFALGVDHKPNSRIGEETSGFVDVNDIIGREDDKKAIIEMLLESKDQEVRFLTVVGVGGQGKTALAQLVYNDEKIKNEFGNLRFWVCVSDQDKQKFDVKAILCKILRLVTNGQKSFDGLEFELVQLEFQKELGGKKYLLVLDDVWNENRQRWVALQKILKFYQGGSKVLVTTRSESTALKIGNGTSYRLEGLSTESSWQLFELKSDYKAYHDEVNHYELGQIGVKIVKRCHNTPLAIVVVGSLLFRQHITKWRSYELSGLAEINKGDNKYSDNEIISVLKLSYHNLESSVKSCFTYCAVFPKDLELEREMLINLWIAQGYIIPNNGSQRIADAANQKFLTLLQRCFFQDVKLNEFGNVKSVKIHDLMHDVAQEVGGEEIQIMSSDANNIGDKVCHMSFGGNICLQSSSNRTKLRSYIKLNFFSFSWDDALVNKFIFVRVLDFKFLKDTKSVDSISELLHLRYLDLSYNSFETLPAHSITKLHNLQTLILRCCGNLRELPHDLSKLQKLRHLDISDCEKLTCMPAGMDRLTSLRVLTDYVVGMTISPLSFEDLQTLTNLIGRLSIRVGSHCLSTLKPMNGSSYLRHMEHLEELHITFDENSVDQEVVLEKLEPHQNLKGLILRSYEGMTIPWQRSVVSFNLIKIEIRNCNQLQNMPSFSKLSFLKSLKLFFLDNLEYMERSSSTCYAETTFFPCLEFLQIHGVPKLKSWFSGENLADRIIPQLSQLDIWSCPSLTSFPSCPAVKTLSCEKSHILVDVVGKRTSCLTTLTIESDDKLKNLSEIKNVFMICGSSLRSLTISQCRNLVSISDGLEHLTMLESLELISNDRLNFLQSDVMPWNSLDKCLRTLQFVSLKGLTSLPKGMQHLTSLQTLKLRGCDKLEAFPQWISGLSSLRYLDIYGSHRLQDRCRKPNGVDWPKIQQIPKINTSD